MFDSKTISLPISYKKIVQILLFFFTCHAHALSLEFLADYNIPNGTVVDSTIFGGLSGLSYDPQLKQYIAISDDRSNLAPARFYHLDIVFENNLLKINPLNHTKLLQINGSVFPSKSIDAEAIAFDSKNNRLFISSEGDGQAIPRLPPSIFITQPNGQVIDEVAIPEKFLPNPTGELVRGVRNNNAFEGISISPSGKFLFAITESALFQDDTIADFSKGSFNRGLVFRIQDDGSLNLEKEFIYPVDPIKKFPNSKEPGDRGVSEILALSDSKFLVMERGGTINFENHWQTQVSLYEVTLSDATTDVSNMDSIQNFNYTPAKKELLMDLDDIVSKLSADYKSLDNLEGLAFGPDTDSGEKTLLIMSDDNFNPNQRTQFILLKMKSELP